jgi:hypothetical protein
MPIIGPNFPHELRAAGLADLPIGWDETDVYGTENLTTEQNNALQAVIAAHDPNVAAPRYLPRKLFFEELVAQTQYDAFMTWKASQPAATKVYFDEESGFPEDSALVQDAMTALGLSKSAFYDAALT